MLSPMEESVCQPKQILRNCDINVSHTKQQSLGAIHVTQQWITNSYLSSKFVSHQIIRKQL